MATSDIAVDAWLEFWAKTGRPRLKQMGFIAREIGTFKPLLHRAYRTNLAECRYYFNSNGADLRDMLYGLERQGGYG